MRECDVRTPEDALSYLVDCTLATVTSMAMRKSRPKGEYARQIRIAEKGIRWMREMGVDLEGTRAEDIVGTDVAGWAKKYEAN